MAVRRERVVLELHDDGFSTKMARNAAATQLLDKSLAGVDGSATGASTSLRSTARDSDDLARSMRRSGPDIDRFSGRLRLAADAGAVLGPSLVPISAVAIPALTGLAAQLGVAVLGMGSLVAASQGVGDALTAVNEAALEPTVKNLEKADQAMAKLGPDAQAFVSRFQELRPVLSDIRDAAASGWFPGLTDALTDLERVAPEVGRLLREVGEVGGGLVAEGADALAGPEWAEFRAFVTRTGPPALEDLGRIIGNIAAGMAELWMAFDPLNQDFSDWLLEASRGFREWSQALSGTEGFSEFVDYIRTNGPRVADALGSLGNALVQIVEAIAPLGGPSLKIIEAFADAVAAIADSDLGTPILGAVAAYAALNRVMQVSVALQTRLGGGRLAQGGLFAVGSTMGRDLRAAAPTVSQFGTVAYRMGQSSKYASEQTLAARSAVRGFASQAARGAAPIAGLALAATGVGDGFGLSNAAAGALMGTLAGPWGAAVGGAIGLMLDISEASKDWEESQRRAQAAIDTRNLDAINVSLDEYEKRLSRLNDLNTTSGVGDFFADVWGLAPWNDGSLTEGLDEQIGEVEDGMDRLRAALNGAGTYEEGAGLRRVKFALAGAAEQSEIAAEALKEFQEQYDNLNAVLSRQGSWDAYQAAIDDLTRSVKDNGKTLDATTEKGRANRDALNGIAEAAIKFSENLIGADRINFLRNAREAFVDGAEKAGGLDRRAREVLETLDELAGLNVRPAIEIKGLDKGLTSTAALEQRMRDLDGTTATVNIKAAFDSLGGFFGGGMADGGTVRGVRKPYGDKVFAMLAPGEEVITNRNGEADRFRADRAAGRIPAYANGGTVGVDPRLHPVAAPPGLAIDYGRLAAAVAQFRPLYGPVTIQPHDYSEFQREMETDRRRAAIGGF